MKGNMSLSTVSLLSLISTLLLLSPRGIFVRAKDKGSHKARTFGWCRGVRKSDGEEGVN